MWQNWGKGLDGASLVTGILSIGGRDVAVYGHDFTLRAGSMDATNGAKLARLIYMAAERGIPLIGMNDSAGAFVPAGVGGLDGYSEAFTALRRICGVVPCISLMFGYNAGGGAYLPRQGSFMIQCDGHVHRTHRPRRREVGAGRGRDRRRARRPRRARHERRLRPHHRRRGRRRCAPRSACSPTCRTTTASSRRSRRRSDPIDRFTFEEDILFRKTFDSPAGMSTPLDITLFIQQICDHGEYFELQPARARNMITAFGRIGGHVVGFVANNSAVATGQIDVDAARKATRFIRFCNLYNVPMIFLEDVTGFLPGTEQESRGIILEGRRLLDAIIDLRVPSHHPDHPQRLRRRVRGLQLALRRRRHGLRDAAVAHRGHGPGRRHRVRVQGRVPRARRRHAESQRRSARRVDARRTARRGTGSSCGTATSASS